MSLNNLFQYIGNYCSKLVVNLFLTTDRKKGIFSEVIRCKPVCKCQFRTQSLIVIIGFSQISPERGNVRKVINQFALTLIDGGWIDSRDPNSSGIFTKK
ncbi:hypothetical protein CEXT_120871 [Caerostris extrusa]|uniref:Uncharacterized protein n=1 Tax=Caerostris extrusa TaxID=172846 RepID=A0AAV4TJB1_CAEEX|nr:hypothetical protein CEXT_120871 [Caerostris extrusa]